MSKIRHPKHFYCQTWKMNFYYFVGWSEKTYLNYVKKHWDYEMNLQGVDGNCLEVSFDGSAGNSVWIRDRKNYAVMAHECVHAAANTLRSRGWKPDFDNEEPLTFLVESIYRNSGVK